MLVYRYALRLQHNEDYDSTSTWDSSSEEDFWGEVGDRPSNMSVVVSMWTPDKKHSDRESHLFGLQYADGNKQKSFFEIVSLCITKDQGSIESHSRIPPAITTNSGT
ncbi:hypothetical protein J6590_067669 [Homalodisca vitripennis]|nr:hypothetical protein J6590_067669 [Homalodisca vitripennis]